MLTTTPTLTPSSQTKVGRRNNSCEKSTFIISASHHQLTSSSTSFGFSTNKHLFTCTSDAAATLLLLLHSLVPVPVLFGTSFAFLIVFALWSFFQVVLQKKSVNESQNFIIIRLWLVALHGMSFYSFVIIH